jgi:PGF-CTERM protein
MADLQTSEATGPENITLANPAPKLAVDSLIVSAASALEGVTVTLTASINNSGTANAVDQTIEFLDGTTVLNATNVSVDMGQVKDVPYIWLLPDVTADTTKNITAKLGDSSAWVNVTIIAKVAKINITVFTAPDGMKIGDTVLFSATIKNEGNDNATGIVVEFYDNATKLNSSAPFNLSAGSSTGVSLNVTLIGTADANHLFFVKAAGAQKNVTKSVAHKPVPASVKITSFTVKPAKRDKQPQDSTQSYTLTVVMQNTGEIKSTDCTLTIKEGSKVISPTPESISIDGNNNLTKTYTWKVKGSGSHTATATLSGTEAGSTAPITTKCTLEYTPGFEVLFLVAAILVAALLVRRRKN